MAAAIEVGQRAGQIIGRPVYTWSTIFGPEPLTVMWTARVEHLAEVVAADDALAADDGFNEWAEQNNALFASPLVGVVSQVVHGAPTGEPKTVHRADAGRRCQRRIRARRWPLVSSLPRRSPG